MPVKVLFIAGAVIVAAGVAVYDNREHVRESFDRLRRKVASSLHGLAHNIAPPSHGFAEELPMAGRSPPPPSYSFESQTHNFFTEGVRGEKEKVKEKDEEEEEVKATGRATPLAANQSMRHRTGQQAEVEKELNNEKSTTSYTSALSRRSSTATLQNFPQQQQQQQQPFSWPQKAQESKSETLPLQESSDNNSNKEHPRNSSSTIDFQPPPPFEPITPYWSIHEWAATAAATATAAAPTTNSSAPSSLAGSAAEEVELSDGDSGSCFGSDLEEEGEEAGSVGSWSEVGSWISGDH